MNNEKSAFIDYLRTCGYSVTKMRIIIYELLAKQQPLSINELVRKLPEADRSSIYRSLNLFEKIGVIQRIQIGWKHKFELSDKFSHHHHHMTCKKCGAVIEIQNLAIIEKALEETALTHSFKTSSHMIEIQGTCKLCS